MIKNNLWTSIGILELLLSFSFLGQIYAADLGRVGGTWTGGGAGLAKENQPFIAGTDSNGGDNYICRALYQGALHPGRVSDFVQKKCVISTDANGLVGLDSYEVLKDQSSFHWVAVRGNWIPNPVVRTGFAAGGAAYYSCRFFKEDGLYAGKVVRTQVNNKDLYTCYTGWSGGVHSTTIYEILAEKENPDE